MKIWYILFIIFSWMIYGQDATNDTTCETTCLSGPLGCSGRVAINPYCSCSHCAKSIWEPCGGKNWELGYCEKEQKCANITGEVLVEIPMIGICKYMRHYTAYKEFWEDDDEQCPEQSGCEMHTGVCDCITRRTCFPDFRYSSYETCKPYQAYLMDYYYAEGYTYEHPKPVCYSQGCDIIDDKCICETEGPCGRKYEFENRNKCNTALVEKICSNVTCPEVEQLKCPADSVASKPHTPPGECCPTIPSFCTCNFKKCNNTCPRRKRKIMIQPTNGVPGNCCDKFLCLH
ncbi:Hypothetical predicted protein [Pelobates cultripes]|uniref:Uncharacterized protein n=1 Tax=Pelobates cultripes TaxID=61616 RepID=A0AAD1T5Y9_PELCU|nr:Hypothetical predicted protein [Pelobates cultripes]